MTDVMIDIETFSTQPNASILTIGAIKFNRKQIQLPIEECETFYRRIDLDSCAEIDLHVDNRTINWWNNQSEESKTEIFSPKNRISIHQALDEFVEWFGDSTFIWSHGSVFDVIIVENALAKCGIRCPWTFWNIRDTRTVYDLGNTRLQNTNTHHALYDAYNQVVCLKKAFRILHL
jgi:DNA polymerase III epsilon subunit-like protein